MNIKHSFVKPEIECTLAAGCSVTGEPFAIELAHVKGRLTMVSGKPVKAGGGSGGSTYTSSDLYLLAKTIYAEGRGEPYAGQVAIGAVILNRVRSSAFPNSVSGVVYQKGAFTAVSDGQINLSPDSMAMSAAQDAVNGWDPTGGAIYYYNPAVATSSWIFSRKTVTVIGKHVFAV